MSTCLVVDDALFMRTMLKGILTNEGYEVIGEAASGDEAILKYEQLKPDIVTMDIVMPGMDGLDAVKGIIEKDPNAKIVMCSALGQQQMVIDALQAGAKEYIVKPFQPLIVSETLKKVAR